MLSSKDGLFDRARGRMVGSDQYLTKPFTKESLLKTVARTCNRPVASSGGALGRLTRCARQRRPRSGTMAIKKILIVDDSPTSGMC